MDIIEKRDIIQEEIKDWAKKVSLSWANNIDLPLLKKVNKEDYHRVARVAYAVSWDINEDCQQTRVIKTYELIDNLKELAIKEFGSSVKMVMDSLEVYNDYLLHRSAKCGIYGWISILANE